jgi:hypothetical protein
MRCRFAIALLVVAAAPDGAGAEPYRLRADALATAQAPAGLVVLQADGQEGPFFAAEALVWVGAGEGGGMGMPEEDTEAEALVIAVRARRRGGEARLGRFVVTAGGLRPVHMDGASGRVRLPRRFALEAFAGSPVAPGIEGRTWDWLAGGRASRSIGDWGSAGIAYLHRRDDGRLTTEEVAADAGVQATSWLDVSGRAALDLIHGGLAEGQATASARTGAWRFEVYGTERSASRLLPATSLFSVLGDSPSRRIGSTTRWRAAPRLDLFAEAGALEAGGEWGELASGRALLRLDDRGTGSLSGELRREGVPGASWTGARTAVRTPPVLGGYRFACEGELAFPDDSDHVWPWGLVALSRRFGEWEAAAAVEASASPTEVYRVDGLARFTWMWGTP